MKRPANEDDSWASDGALFARRGPIRSHRRPRRPRRTGIVRLGSVAVATTVAGASWTALAGLSDRPPAPTAEPPPPGAEAPVEPAPDGGSSDPPASPLPSVEPPPLSPPAAGRSRPAVPPAASISRQAPPAAPPAVSARPAAPSATSTRPTPPTTTTTAVAPKAVAPVDGLVVQVVSRTSGLPVGVRRGSTLDGAAVVQRTTTGATERWRLTAAGSGCYQLVNVSSGKALDLTDGSHADGTPMQQWGLGPGNINQTWCFRSLGGGWYSIRSAASGALLDLRDGGTGDGVTIQQWGADPAAPNTHQTWRLVPPV
ncbi:RICIN domain-containing protein [Micromonospora sp. NPDC018662]|uniref:RICIN domain-containing protein n=1 Tax=Micromonospora sp. NPDC018662 TaxID=3364238 RepID=UPI0037B00EDF